MRRQSLSTFRGVRAAMAGWVSVNLADPEYRQIDVNDDNSLRAVAVIVLMRESWRGRESPRVRRRRAVNCRSSE